MSSKNIRPPEQLLEAIEEIADIKRRLSFRDRAETTAYGLYIQSGLLPGGAIQYMAGGKFRKKLVFVREPDGSTNVKNYQPGDWQSKIDDTLATARALERRSRGQQDWPEDKVLAYWAPETFNVEVVDRVDRVYQQHLSEVGPVWDGTSPEQRAALSRVFLKELEQEWPTEYLEVMCLNSPTVAVKAGRDAYLIGYMVGRSWITAEEATSFNFYQGQVIVKSIRSNSKHSESRATAFASALASVGAHGAKLALSNGVRSD